MRRRIRDVRVWAESAAAASVPENRSARCSVFDAEAEIIVAQAALHVQVAVEQVNALLHVSGDVCDVAQRALVVDARRGRAPLVRYSPTLIWLAWKLPPAIKSAGCPNSLYGRKYWTLTPSCKRESCCWISSPFVSSSRRR